MAPQAHGLCEPKSAALTHMPAGKARSTRAKIGETPSAGLIPRALAELFAESAAASDGDALNTRITLSYMEIYNERIHDLLQPYKSSARLDPQDMRKRKAGLEVKDRGPFGTVVPGALAVKVRSVEQSLGLLKKGNQHRALVLEQRMPGGILRSKLNFVDLAGSERWSAHVEMSNVRVNELTSINQSLSTLITVVACLTEEGRSHIPYRDSKLTHLLQDSLGGNCNTMIIATISPSILAFEETCNTLKFADRARNITNRVTVNLKTDLKQELELKNSEIRRLTELLAKYAGLMRTSGGYSRPGTSNPVMAAPAPPEDGAGAVSRPATSDTALQAAAAVAQQRAELNHLKAELLLAREDLAAERASRLKLQAAIASQAHAEASRARQEHLQQAAALPAGSLQPSDSVAALGSPVPAQEPGSMMVVSSGSTRFGRPAQTLTIPDARSVSAFPSPEAAALQPPEPAPSTGSTPASTINSMQHLPTSNSTGSLPILYGTSNTNISVGSPERGRRPATKPSSPKKRLGLDSPAARALRVADTKTLDKGSLIFVMGSKGNSLTAKQVHRVNQLQLAS
eukprot:jgi/Astpho2/2891/fgenesh1_pg.00050_%23_142_t